MLLGNLLAKHESGTEGNGGHAGNGHNGKASLRGLSTGIGGRLGGRLLGHDGMDGQGIRGEGHGAVGAGGLGDDLVLNTLGLVVDVNGHLGVGVSSTQVVGKLIRSLNLAGAGNLEGADLGKASGVWALEALTSSAASSILRVPVPLQAAAAIWQKSHSGTSLYKHPVPLGPISEPAM